MYESTISGYYFYNTNSSSSSFSTRLVIFLWLAIQSDGACVQHKLFVRATHAGWSYAKMKVYFWKMNGKFGKIFFLLYEIFS